MCRFRNFYCEVGAARSGTNFLGEVLSAHPLLAYWRRPKYVWRHGNAWRPDDCLRSKNARPRVKRYIRRRFHDHMAGLGKERLLVCTQANSLALEFVNEVFPEGKIIHIIRDGREVTASQSREWQVHVRGRGQLLYRMPEVPLTDWPAYAVEVFGTLWHRYTRSKHRYSMGPKIKNWKRLRREIPGMEYSALTWQECVGAALRVGRAMPKDRYYEVRFEDLVLRSQETVAALLDFMELPPAKEVDEYIERHVKRGNVGKWLSSLSQEQLQRILPYMDELLRELGYLQSEPVMAGDTTQSR